MITDKDVTKLQKTFVTKDDLKKELNQFSTKADIKKELTRFATKEDLEQVELNTGAGFLDVQRQFSEVRADISELKEGQAELMEGQTEMKGDIKDIRLQMAGMEQNIIAAIREIKDDHEVTKQRVTKLERLAFSN